MSRIEWDKTGERLFETGVDRGVLYPQAKTGEYQAGVPWNGLTAVTQSPSGAEANDLYADNMKYLTFLSAEDFGATVEAYMYPDEFAVCDGSAEIAPGVHIGQQDRLGFGLSYRTLIGNDVAGSAHGYKIHIIYGCKAAPSERNYQTVNDSPDAMTVSWELSTTPVNVTGFKPSAHVEIDSTACDAEKLAELEAILYGSEEGEARLPMPDEIAALLKAA